MPMLVMNRVEGYLFMFTMSYILLSELTDEKLKEVQQGIYEITSKVKESNFSLKDAWRYRVMYKAFRLYRWLFRMKKRWVG